MNRSFSRPLKLILLVLASAVAIVGIIVLSHYLLAWWGERGYEERMVNRTEVWRADVDGSVAVRNPVITTGQDPWISKVGNRWYYVYTQGRELLIKSSDHLYDWDSISPMFTWHAEESNILNMDNVWAPELHQVDGQWVIYFAANDGGAISNDSHRTYVLTARNNDPSQGFEYAGELRLPDDAYSIDGTPLEYSGKLYLLWSGRRPDEGLNQFIHISQLADPLTAVGKRVLISEPTYDWETRGRRGGLWPKINEGPQVLKHQGRTFVVYSASGSWSNYYCLGLLELIGDDPLDPAAWRKYPQPVLEGYGDVLAPGHASFVHNGDQDLIFYHVAKYDRSGWDREVHVKPFEWTSTGEPDFGQPVGREEWVKLGQ